MEDSFRRNGWVKHRGADDIEKGYVYDVTYVVTPKHHLRKILNSNEMCFGTDTLSQVTAMPIVFSVFFIAISALRPISHLYPNHGARTNPRSPSLPKFPLESQRPLDPIFGQTLALPFTLDALSARTVRDGSLRSPPSPNWSGRFTLQLHLLKSLWSGFTFMI